MEWGLGIQMLKQNPLFGFGYQRWPDFSGGMAAHNSLVNCFGELGLVGYACWFTLCLIVVKSAAPPHLPREPSLEARIPNNEGNWPADYTPRWWDFLRQLSTRTHCICPALYFLLGMGVGLSRWIESQQQTPTPLAEVPVRDIRQGVIFSMLSIPVIWVIIRVYWIASGAA